MKNKLDWFDDDWKWDVLPTRMLFPYLPMALESRNCMLV